MYLIVGLGNPGRQYEHTRHNCGFDAIDEVAYQMGIAISSKEHKALVGKGYAFGQKVLLAKPQTFMNLSGESVLALCAYYKIDPETQLIVLYDDIDLSPGQLRIRKNGSPGGHNGMKNITALLGTKEFTRIRIGIGAKPEGRNLADYVLSHFSPEERELLDEAFSRTADAVQRILKGDLDGAMNQYNKKKKQKQEDPDAHSDTGA
ncbi:MAG: aminoacyl-tRNA hydrolase [Lachnospiraceae bacterium]|nr:aminoacyl-tRNA hydrolase [Lachnospiraceae bacterium]